MNTKHTPRPWIRDSGCIYAEIQLDNGLTRERPIAAILDSRSEHYCANARLIAAAPDLLESLINCRSLMVALGSASDPIIAAADIEARAAIAKAKGEE